MKEKKNDRSKTNDMWRCLTVLLFASLALGIPNVSTEGGNLTLAVDTGADVVVSFGATQTVALSAFVGLVDEVNAMSTTQQQLVTTINQLQTNLATTQQQLADEQAARATLAAQVNANAQGFQTVNATLSNIAASTVRVGDYARDFQVPTPNPQWRYQ
jgi:septal ring factor EnvC (AmiA/AmiB activator)